MIQSNKSILIFPGPEELEDFAVNKWKMTALASIKDRGRFSVALSGGNTPRGLYRKLSENSELPWDKTHIFIVDDRFVPDYHEESNYRMIRETLLDHIEIAGENIHPILTDTGSPDESAVIYEKYLNSYFNTDRKGFPRFDLILLGIGDDGHTASLFPGTRALSETSRKVTQVSLPDRSKRDRVTLTLPVINNARNIIFMATGEKKSGTIKDIVKNRDSALPASRVDPEDGSLLFLLDESAGKLIKEPKRED